MEDSKILDKMSALEDLLFDAIFPVLDDRLLCKDETVILTLPKLIDLFLRIHEINKKNK